jgi:hypothetical protein
MQDDFEKKKLSPRSSTSIKAFKKKKNILKSSRGSRDILKLGPNKLLDMGDKFLVKSTS